MTDNKINKFFYKIILRNNTTNILIITLYKLFYYIDI